MRCVLLFAGTPVGYVDLDGGEPAAGYLEPLPAYEERAGPVFRRAGNAVWAERAHGRALDPPDAATGPPELGEFAATLRAMAASRSEAQAEAAAHTPHLALATEAGTPIAADALELWDMSGGGEPPFVLATFGAAAAAVRAVVTPAPRAAHDAR